MWQRGSGFLMSHDRGYTTKRPRPFTKISLSNCFPPQVTLFHYKIGFIVILIEWDVKTCEIIVYPQHQKKKNKKWYFSQRKKWSYLDSHFHLFSWCLYTFSLSSPLCATKLPFYFVLLLFYFHYSPWFILMFILIIFYNIYKIKLKKIWKLPIF